VGGARERRRDGHGLRCGPEISQGRGSFRRRAVVPEYQISVRRRAEVGGGSGQRGRAVQLDPMNTTLKAPGCKRLDTET